MEIIIKISRKGFGIRLEPVSNHNTDPFRAQDNDASFHPKPPTERPNVPCPRRPEPHVSDYYR
jgi:hypothetical protein